MDFEIKCVHKNVYLGAIIDLKLCWKPHIEYISKISKSYLCLLCNKLFKKSHTQDIWYLKTMEIPFHAVNKNLCLELFKFQDKT